MIFYLNIYFFVGLLIENIFYLFVGDVIDLKNIFFMFGDKSI